MKQLISYISRDIASTFDNVWHRGLLHKLASYVVLSVKYFLSGWSMKVVYIDHAPDSHEINAGVPPTKGFLFNPIPFYIKINDLSKNRSLTNIYEGDTKVYGFQIS